MRTVKIAVSAALLAMCVVQSAFASLVTADPNTGTTTVFTPTGNNGFGNAGPVVINGFSWTGAPQVTYGNACYGLAGNGNWSCSGNFGWVATNNGNGSMTVDLGGLYGFAGFFMNYAPGYGAVSIEALAADGITVLESYALLSAAPISTSGPNGGAFRGIDRSQSDIEFLRVTGAYSIVHTLEIGNSAQVPEPGTLSLLGLSLIGLGFARRRKQQL